MTHKNWMSLTKSDRLLDLQVDLVVFNYAPTAGDLHIPRFYSSNIYYAKEASAKMAERGFVCKTTDLTAFVGYACYQAAFFRVGNPDASYMAEASTEALAICKAAVGAMMTEEAV